MQTRESRKEAVSRHKRELILDARAQRVRRANGEKVRVDASGYEKYCASPNKADRDAAFKAFWTRYNEFTRTYAAMLNATVEASVAHRDVRKSPTTLDASLFDYNIPRNAYTQLLADVNANLPTLHRYLKLRQKIMGLPTLGYEDLYAPMVDKVDLQYTPEQAMAAVDAFAAPVASTSSSAPSTSSATRCRGCRSARPTRTASRTPPTRWPSATASGW